jgi:putative transposase
VGYCLMTNHVHLIVGASDRLGAIGELMKRLAGRQTRFVNKMEGRTGSLWESRYKVSPIDTDDYLLQCCRYVELNPVKAGMVPRADDYVWSSYRARVGKEICKWLDVPPTFGALGVNHAQRIEKYSDFVNQLGDARKESEFIGAAVERNQLTGGAKFIDEVERRTGIRVEFRSRGRPASKRK